jgi:hypothetical protein
MGFVWGLIAAGFIGIYVLVHRARVKTMRRYINRGNIESGPWGDNPPDMRNRE